jgi:hypothetical protein
MVVLYVRTSKNAQECSESSATPQKHVCRGIVLNIGVLLWDRQVYLLQINASCPRRGLTVDVVDTETRQNLNTH